MLRSNPRTGAGSKGLRAILPVLEAGPVPHSSRPPGRHLEVERLPVFRFQVNDELEPRGLRSAGQPVSQYSLKLKAILVATWDNGLFSVTGKMVHQELADQSVRSLVADGRGRVLAIVGHSLCRRSSDGEWTAIAKSEFELSCCVAIGNVVFVGTDDAHILRVDPAGAQQCLTGFDADGIADRGALTYARRVHAHLHRLFRGSVGRGIIDTTRRRSAQAGRRGEARPRARWRVPGIIVLAFRRVECNGRCNVHRTLRAPDINVGSARAAISASSR